jgi:hypothetical protein
MAGRGRADSHPMLTRPLRLLLCTATLSLGAASTAAAQPVQAEAFNVEFGVMFWKPEPDLVITTPSFAPVGGTVDFVNAFGIEEKRFVEFRAVLKGGKHKFRASRVVFDYEDTATIQGVTATSDIEWELWRVGYEYDALRADQGFVGLVAELKYNEVEASIGSPLGGASTLQKAPIPTVGGIARAYIGDYVSVTGEFTLLSFDGDEVRGEFYDLDLYGIAHFGPSVGVQFGFRRVHTEYLVDDNDEGDLEMLGLYFGGLVRF